MLFEKNKEVLLNAAGIFSKFLKYVAKTMSSLKERFTRRFPQKIYKVSVIIILIVCILLICYLFRLVYILQIKDECIYKHPVDEFSFIIDEVHDASGGDELKLHIIGYDAVQLLHSEDPWTISGERARIVWHTIVKISGDYDMSSAMIYDRHYPCVDVHDKEMESYGFSSFEYEKNIKGYPCGPLAITLSDNKRLVIYKKYNRLYLREVN